MTGLMREALQSARKAPLRRVHNVEHGKPQPPAAWQTLRALEARGFLAYSERKTKRGERLEEWVITDAGREALLPREVFKEERPVYLARPVPDRRGDYSTNPAWSIDHLPIMDPDHVSLRWRRKAEIRRVGSQDARVAAGRVSRSLRAA